jgi:hypothetical protein
MPRGVAPAFDERNMRHVEPGAPICFVLGTITVEL